MQAVSAPSAGSQGRAKILVFLSSFLILFLELALIRWIPGHVRVVGYFSNLVLLACFVGMGIGCLLVRVSWPLVRLAPLVLVGILLMTHYFSGRAIVQSSAQDQQHLWLGEYADLPPGVREFGIPAVLSTYFAVVSLMFVALGHAFGQAFRRLGGLEAYSIDILGSLAGTCGFALLSYFEAPPWTWFLVAGAVLAALVEFRRLGGIAALVVYAYALAMVALFSGDALWSPYYRITYQQGPHMLDVNVNASFHQTAVMMTPEVAAREPEVGRLLRKFSLPYRYCSPRRVLILGAGTGNDVLVARSNGAAEIVAVEIDPVIARLGREKNRARPYDAANVRLVVDDARSFLKKSNEKFDLIVIGTLDSQALLGGMSSLRLENYVYTRECFEELRRHLAPGGVLATYYSIMKPWILEKLTQLNRMAFGRDPALFLADDPVLFNTIILQSESDEPLPAERRAMAARRSAPPELVPTDDWPFLYLHARQIAPDTLWVIAFCLLWTLVLVGGTQLGARAGFSPGFFFLGAGFMLLEAKGVTEMSLLFGSTWLVNVLVIGGILLMILLANLILLRWRVGRVEWLFLALFASLALRGLFPVGSLIHASPVMQTALAVLRVGAPVFFAGLIFAAMFSRAASTTTVLGANLVGAMAGGLSENLSVIFGFRALDWLALGVYVAAYLSFRLPALLRRRADMGNDRDGVSTSPAA